jgi:uncharacterized membrane protein
MENYQYFVLARALHVVGVVIWIGGVAFVTMVLIPSLKTISKEDLQLELFEKLENKFSFYARITTLLTGFSGFYMLEYMHAWNRYLDLRFWWIHLMTFIWIIFTLVLFVLEPLFLHRWFHEQAAKNSKKAFRLITILHIVLLSISLIAVFFAVAGAHGLSFF